MRVALDTNVLAYAEGLGDAARCRAAAELIERLEPDHVLVPVQVLGELQRVLVSKSGRDPSDVRTVILSWADCFMTGDSTWSAVEAALDLAADHRLQIWDAMVLAVAAEHQCRLLLTEDLQEGFTWRGVTVANPFATRPSWLLNVALGDEKAGPRR